MIIKLLIIIIWIIEILSRPFYQSVITMGLNPISEKKYTEFAQQQFEKYGKSIDGDVVKQVYDRFDGVTAYLQRVLNVLYLNTEKNGRCTTEMIEDSIDFIINLNSEHYETLYSQMSERQRQVFLAIAMERRAKNISGSQFIHKYHLISSSSVVSAVRGAYPTG